MVKAKYLTIGLGEKSDLSLTATDKRKTAVPG